MAGKEIASGILNAAKAVVNEAIMPAAEKLIPQGAAEISQALFNGNGYVPYGPTEKPVPMEGLNQGGVHGQAVTTGEPEPPAPTQGLEQKPPQGPEPGGPTKEGYAAMLNQHNAQLGQGQGQERSRGMDR